MSDPHRIRQKRQGYTRDYLFGTDTLTCIVRDTSGRREYSVAYQTIDPGTTSTLTVNRTPRLGLIFLVCLLLIFAMGTATAADMPDSVVTALGLAALVVFLVGLTNRWTGLFSATFTLMPVRPAPPGTNGTLMILHDGLQDDVIAAIRDARNRQLATLYGQVNPDADPAIEAKRMAWLLDIGAIDQQHHDRQMARLAFARDPVVLPAGPVN